MNARWHLSFLVALGALAGCATQVRVVHNSTSSPGSRYVFPPARQHWWESDSACGDVVRHHGLEGLIRTNPALALQTLHRAATQSAKSDERIATARLTIRHAKEVERTQPAKAADLYLSAAALVYRSFAGVSLPSTNHWASLPAVRTYNQATLGLVMSLQKLSGGIRGNHSLSLWGQPVQVKAQAGDIGSDPWYYDRWLAADHWKQIGLTHTHRLDGLGARLVAVRTNWQTTALELRQPDEGIFQASTAVLRFPSSEGDEAVVQTQTVKLLFYNPTLTPEIEFQGQPWLLAADFTTPVAMLLSRTRPLFKTRWTGLVSPGKTPRPHRLYLMQPYSPDRIPVIMVHG